MEEKKMEEKKIKRFRLGAIICSIIVFFAWLVGALFPLFDSASASTCKSPITAYADTEDGALPTGNELDYYFVIPAGSVIGGLDRCIIDDNVGCISLNLYLGETLNSYYRYSYAVWYRTNSIATSVHGQPFFELSNRIIGGSSGQYNYTVLSDFVVYLNSNIIDLLGDRFPNNVKLLSLSITYNSTSYSGWSISGLSNDLLPIYSVPSYSNGYQDGLSFGLSQRVSNPFTTLLTPVDVFLSTPLFGEFSIGDFLSVALFVSLALIFLKMFAGG